MIKTIRAIKNNPLTFQAIVALVLATALFYIYCVNSSVRNVVARRQTEEKILELRNSVSDLEYRYSSVENQLTLEKARALGLREPQSKIFISRNDEGGKLLSLNRP